MSDKRLFEVSSQPNGNHLWVSGSVQFDKNTVFNCSELHDFLSEKLDDVSSRYRGAIKNQAEGAAMVYIETEIERFEVYGFGVMDGMTFTIPVGRMGRHQALIVQKDEEIRFFSCNEEIAQTGAPGSEIARIVLEQYNRDCTQKQQGLRRRFARKVFGGLRPIR